MIIIWGSRLYGKVDQIPSLGYVATKFFHLWFIPFVPEGSHLIIQEMGDGWYGAPIPLNWKSVLVAWGRVFGIIAGGILGLVALGGFADYEESLMMGIVCTLLSACCVAAVILTYVWGGITMAGYDRAVRIAQEAGVTAGGLATIAAAYNRMEDAQRYAATAQVQQQALIQAQETPPPLPVWLPVESLPAQPGPPPPPLPNQMVNADTGGFVRP